MASSRIDSVLDNIKCWVDRTDNLSNLVDPLFKEEFDERLEILKLELKLVRTFLLCARKWSFDGWELLGNSLFNFETSGVNLAQAPNILQGQEISGMYRTLLYLSSKSNHSPVIDDAFWDFNNSLLENLVDILNIEPYNRGLFKVEFETLQEKLKCLKDLNLCATWQGVDLDPWKSPMARFQVVAVQAANLSCRCWFDSSFREDWHDDHHSMISNLRQEMKLLEAQFSKTCLQGLRASKLSGSFRTPKLENDICIFGDFADSFSGKLWEVLNSGTSFLVSKQDQMQVLYDGLRFFRTIFKKQQQKFKGLHQKMKDLSRSVIHEAGILIFSLFANRIEETLPQDLDLAFSVLLQKIKLIKIVASTFESSGTNGLGFIKFHRNNLKELAGLDLIAYSKDQIQEVQKELKFLGSIFKKHEKLTAFKMHVLKEVHKVMFVINSSDLSPSSFDRILEEIFLLKIEALVIDVMCVSEAQKLAKISNYVSLQESNPHPKDDLVGFHDVIHEIIGQVTNIAQKKLDILSIVGMAGLGKTTLAKRVYEHPVLRNNFKLRAWCNVSQEYQNEGLLREILGCIHPENSKLYSQKEEGALALELKQSLLKNKYLIILDDVWDIKAWNTLKVSFPDDENGSRIIITSRMHGVASDVKCHSEPHRLRPFNDNESWELLKKTLFPNDDFPPKLQGVGMQIAKSCGGLPLSVVIIAGILRTIEYDGWEEFAAKLCTSVVSSTEQCINMLELSYRRIPDCLKKCFLYFGAFVRGEEIPTKRLMWLWIAEGFVQQVEQEESEEVAERYMNDLIDRNLIMVAKRRSIGGVKTCCVHDLIREFCAAKAKEKAYQKRGEEETDPKKGKEKNFLQLLHGYDGLFTFSESYNTSRFCIYSKQEHFEKSRLFCPQIRCLMFFSHGDRYPIKCCDSLFIFKICKLLTVLDLGEVRLGDRFPTEIEVLVKLRYLAIWGKMKSIPSSIDNLTDLETFLVKGYSDDDIKLPENLWSMMNLRHLVVSNCYGDISLAKDNVDDSWVLCNLSTFSNLALVYEQGVEKIFTKFPNIRRLKCELRVPEDSEDLGTHGLRVVSMGFLTQLKSLTLSLRSVRRSNPIQLHLPLNLEKLSLSYFTWSMIPEIEKLTNLVVLKLSNDKVDIWYRDEDENMTDSDHEEEIPEVVGEGEQPEVETRWDMAEEVEFPKLRLLKLSSTTLSRWTGSGDHFPGLQRLVLEGCWNLKEMPYCLGSSSPLQMIEIRYCPFSVEFLVDEIERQQKYEGNQGLQTFRKNVEGNLFLCRHSFIQNLMVEKLRACRFLEEFWAPDF